MASDKQRFIDILNRANDTPPLSDVEYIELWATQIDAWLAGKIHAGIMYASNYYLPDPNAERALMNLETDHRSLVEQIFRMVRLAEEKYIAAEQGIGHVDDAASQMFYLWITLNNSIKTLKTKPADVPGTDFIPSEMQREILVALNGQAMTADKLEKALSRSRSTLYQKPGGLDELIEKGKLKNDRKIGGYYRPDAPPISDSD